LGLRAQRAVPPTHYRTQRGHSKPGRM